MFLVEKACFLSYNILWVGFILEENINWSPTTPVVAFSKSGPTGILREDFRLHFHLDGDNMTLQEQYNRWKESTLKKSLAKTPERKTHFETSAGIEVPREA